jgi:hypothetical protein
MSSVGIVAILHLALSTLEFVYTGHHLLFVVLKTFHLTHIQMLMLLTHICRREDLPQDLLSIVNALFKVYNVVSSLRFSFSKFETSWTVH